jgi:hypothetical protein
LDRATAWAMTKARITTTTAAFPIPSYYARDAAAGVRHVADREPHEAKARAKETLIHPVGLGSRLATFRTNTA